MTGTLHYFDAELPLKKCRIGLLKHDLYNLRPYGKGNIGKGDILQSEKVKDYKQSC